MNFAASKPELGLLRLRYDPSGCVIETHVSERLVVFSEDWTMTILSDKKLSDKKCNSRINGVVSAVKAGHAEITLHVN